MAYDATNKIAVVVGEVDGTDAEIWTIARPDLATERTNPKNIALNEAAWDSEDTENMVAVGDADGSDAYILTSPNPYSTWTERSNSKNANLNAICFSPTVVAGGRFVAVGDYEGASDAYIVTSDDGGVTWTERSNPSSQNLTAVCWDAVNTMFIATGYNSTVLTSPDGVTWTSRTFPSSGHQLWALAAGSGVALCVSYTSPKMAAYSTDGGINWTQLIDFPALAISQPWKARYLPNNRFAVVGQPTSSGQNAAGCIVSDPIVDA
jgi:hypothetical protein